MRRVATGRGRCIHSLRERRGFQAIATVENWEEGREGYSEYLSLSCIYDRIRGIPWAQLVLVLARVRRKTWKRSAGPETDTRPVSTDYSLNNKPPVGKSRALIMRLVFSSRSAAELLLLRL
jgi:hypothetical protein